MEKMKDVTLVLQDGTTFKGKSFGYEKPVAGEVVFNTAMMGYPESLTDPSYAGQLMTLTYPLVGNYGVPPFTMEADGIATFMESDKIYASAIIVSDYSEAYSHWNANERTPETVDYGSINWVDQVSCKDVIRYNEGAGKKVVLVDCGVKHNIIRCLINRGVEVIRVPWNYDYTDMQFDGLFLANGPGDPDRCVDHNQPVREVGTNRCYVTSQNHGYAVDAATLGNDWRELFVNMNDGSNEGIRHQTNPWFSSQFHPEACSGPVDTEFMFDRFIETL